jgi:hypothetical protein
MTTVIETVIGTRSMLATTLTSIEPSIEPLPTRKVTLRALGQIHQV